jgi:hypothetical protein
MLMLQPIISVAPPQISLPASPLGSALIHTVSIRNSGTNVVKLSDATVNDSRVGVAVKETEVGKAFSVEINIPQGFEFKPGQSTEVVIKSTHPQYPEIKIPVLPIPPAPAAATGIPIPPAAAAHAP